MQVVQLILHLLNKCVCIVIITNFKAEPSRSVPYQSETLTPSSLGFWATLLVRSLASCCVEVFSQGRSAPLSQSYSIYDQLSSHVFSTKLIYSMRF